MQSVATRITFRSVTPTWLLIGFLFWVAFLLVLEPGNIARATALGRSLSVSREAARIFCAAVLGTAAVPAVLAITNRYSLSGPGRWRNAVWLLCALVAVAGVLNIVSSFVAAWGFDRRLLPGLAAVSRQLQGNWALLTFALACLAAILAVEKFRRSKTEAKPGTAAPEVLREVIVKSGRRSLRVSMENVDWIEAQGNYVALHIGDRTHLLRETLNHLEAQLDPGQFVRIHRGTIVSLNKVQGLSSDANGEATLQLANGQVQKISRRYRKTVRDRWEER
jgi:hypothetical protein